MLLLKKIYKAIIPARSGFQFFLWKYRHVINRSWATQQFTSENLAHPHRLKLLKKVTDSAPFHSLLEIGCATGINLYLIAGRFPEAMLTGIDINNRAVRFATDYFEKEGLQNVRFLQANLANLSRFADNSFDIIMSDAVLIYADNKIIETLAQELSRIAKQTVILVEFDSENTDARGFTENKLWVRDYEKLFAKYASGIQKHVVEPGEWPGNWEKYGKYITITLKKKR